MEPERNGGPKISTALYIALTLLVIVAVCFGFFTFRFFSQNKTLKEQWKATAANRLSENEMFNPTEEPTPTPVPTVKPSSTPTPTPTPTPEPTQEPEKLLPIDNVLSDNACLVRASDGAVLLDKAAYDRINPASTSKIMTAIVALENIQDLEAPVTVYPEDIDPGYLQEASMAGFEPYEEVKVIDLLYGALLPSGAEACQALATTAASSEEAFVELMNKKAEELGMTATHFANPTGLHDENHYTTCYDMVKLMTYCMQNQTFRNIVSTPEYTCTPNDVHPEGLVVRSTVYDGMPRTSFDNGAVFEGGKTGTTEEAGRCLISGVAFYGEEYFLCTAHYFGDIPGQFEDAVTVYSELSRE